MSQQTIGPRDSVPASSGRQTLVAHFTSRDNADEARERLLEEGVSEDAIHVYPDVAPRARATAFRPTTPRATKAASGPRSPISSCRTGIATPMRKA